MRGFLLNNRVELIRRCKDKVALRPARDATREQLLHGIPMFLNQLTRTLEAEDEGDAAGGLRISGASGGEGSALSEMGVSATVHGGDCLDSATPSTKSFTTMAICAKPSLTLPSKVTRHFRSISSVH